MIKKHLLNMTPFQMNKSQGSIYLRVVCILII